MFKLTFSRLLTLSFLITSLSSCEFGYDIMNPIIYIDDPYPYVGRNITIRVSESAERDGVKEPASEFKWTIKNQDGKNVGGDLSNSKTIEWDSDIIGIFDIKVKVGYSGLRSSKAEKQITINTLDDRANYTGYYHFMKVSENWTENSGHNSDTIFTDGAVWADPYRDDYLSVSCGGRGISGAMEFYRHESKHPCVVGSRDAHDFRWACFMDYDTVVAKFEWLRREEGVVISYYGSKIK